MINSKSQKSNTGYKGVYFRKDNGKFRSQLRLYNPFNNNKPYNVEIGQYDTLKEAIKAREDFIKSLF